MDKNIISNKFVRFGISCFNVLYLILISALAVWTFLYKLVFTNQTGFYVFYISLSLIFCVLMILTRNQLFTRIVSLAILFPVFLLTLFNMSQPMLFLPPLIVGILMFFICGASDTPKIILGSLYLLMFIVGLVGYNILTTLFGGSAVETKLDYTVTDTEITSVYNMEKIIIVVEPNDKDVKYRLFDLIESGYTSRIAKYQIRGVTPDIEWVLNDEYSEGSENARYKLRYRFGDGAEWKTSTINIPEKKNYLWFMNIN